MYSLTVYNYKSPREVLNLTGNPAYTVTEVAGLGSLTADVNTAKNANYDGTTFKGSSVQERNIVIEFSIEEPVEENRIALYKFFAVKRRITLEVQNGTRAATIDGYVESFEIEMFNKKEMAQASIICPSPFFKSKTVYTKSLYIGQGNVVITNGDAPCGAKIRLMPAAGKVVVDPVIRNQTTGGKMAFNVTVRDGHELTVNTVDGEKSIMLDGVNAINALILSESEWITLAQGGNTIIAESDYEGSDASAYAGVIEWNDLYEGM